MSGRRPVLRSSAWLCLAGLALSAPAASGQESVFDLSLESLMELQVDVDEADIGQVKEGQSARFTVDAWANRQFPAQIVRVGLKAMNKYHAI